MPAATTITVQRDRDGLRLRAPKIHLEVIGGPDRGRVVALGGTAITVGSGRGCELILGDAAVSRHHATIVLDERGVRVVDAGSRNGTILDGVNIVDAFAREGSIIRVGQSELRVTVQAETFEVPLHPDDHLGGMIGGSVVMRRLFALIERVAPTDTTVLIEGETGTGKELVAEAIHDRSQRCDGPMVVLDCSAATGSLVESELFGHRRGAFTGAIADRAGAFEAADGGTLFLDEVGELPLDLQPKLLRALETREIRPLGAEDVRAVDVRIVAATNRNLAAMVERGAFREDLYYRLAVVRLETPPLRDRREDIAPLAQAFARRFAERHRGAPELTDQALRRLSAAAYPGNVRELRNQVERLLSVGDTVSLPAPPPTPALVDLDVPFSAARDAVLGAFEAAYVKAALAASDGNVSAAARRASVTRKFIHRVINDHGLRDD